MKLLLCMAIGYVVASLICPPIKRWLKKLDRKQESRLRSQNFLLSRNLFLRRYSERMEIYTREYNEAKFLNEKYGRYNNNPEEKEIKMTLFVVVSQKYIQLETFDNLITPFAEHEHLNN